MDRYRAALAFATVAALAATVPVTACGGAGCGSAAAQPPAKPPVRATGLRNVRSWGYQLQGNDGEPVDLERLASSSFDLLVIDYASNGRPLSSEQVAALQRKPDGSRRYVVAYLSIGEAETYRYYWRRWDKKPPGFLTRPNPEWPDNYKVRYWQPSWQRILFGVRAGRKKSYLDRIIDAGFDGVYLDIVDAYEYFSPGGGGKVRRSAAADMATLVKRLSNYARVERKRSDFLVIPQNGSGILGHLGPALRRDYLAAIDAIAAEDAFHYGDKKNDNPSNVQEPTIAELLEFLRADKRVFVVEYLTRREWARAFVQRARDLGFVPYVGRRSLDRLVPQSF